MEIPTEEIIEQLEILLPPHRRNAIQLIKAQALEIRELQATICRLKDEYRISSDLRELEKNNG
jgi:hypothetical protein